MTVAGVFIINQLGEYMMDNVRTRFTKVITENMQILASYDDLSASRAEIQNDITAWSNSLSEEIYVADNSFEIIAASNERYRGISAFEVLDRTLVVRTFNGESTEIEETTASGVPVVSFLYPIQDTSGVKGIIVLRADVSNVYETETRARSIFFRSMAIALAITVILSLLISRSITIPIKDVTQKARKMAEGDFSQEVSVKSNDEIGQLAQMFNMLRGELDLTISDLTSEKNRQSTIFRYMADGLLAIDRETRNVLLMNPAARNMLGLPVSESGMFPYSRVEELLGSEVRFDRMWKNAEEGGVRDILDHKGRIFDLRYDRFKDDENEDAGLIVILQDITEQQKAEALQRDFVANVSHELKTPLTNIKSYTETLLDGAASDPETASRFLSIIDSEADRMNRLVKDLLQLSRLDHKQEKMSMKELDLVPLVRSCIAKMEMTARQKSQTIEAVFPDDLQERVVMDKDRMEQVIQNVLSNAIKYTQDGGAIRVGIREEADENRKKWVLVDVADNGIGIAESEQARVFERFYRVDKARSRAMGGTGLGLSIARQIMEEHGGTILLTSPGLGLGTTVTLKVPHAPTRGVRGIE
jgi:two-component system sensor histidine kinase VicK